MESLTAAVQRPVVYDCPLVPRPEISSGFPERHLTESQQTLLWDSNPAPTGNVECLLTLKKYAPHLLTSLNHPSVLFGFIEFDKEVMTLVCCLPNVSRGTSDPQTILSPQQQELLAQLESWWNRPEEDRWPGAEWPTEQAFVEAEAFICTLPLPPIAMPDMGLGSDGEINFLWECEGVEIDLGLYGTQSYSYYARGKDGREEFCDQAPTEKGLTDTLRMILMD